MNNRAVHMAMIVRRMRLHHTDCVQEHKEQDRRSNDVHDDNFHEFIPRHLFSPFGFFSRQCCIRVSFARVAASKDKRKQRRDY
jgi:hypothetical protein